MDIIHVIGKVGAGKTHFIRKYLAKQAIEVFDIQDVYREWGFTPADLFQSGKYAQFSGAIHQRIEGFIHHFFQTKGLFVIESSGINGAIKLALEKVNHYTLYIHSTYSDTIQNERDFDVASLNALIEKNFEEETLRYDTIYYGNHDDFNDPLPEPYLQYIKN